MQQLPLSVPLPRPAQRRRPRRPGPPAAAPAPLPAPARRLWLCIRFPSLAVGVHRPPAGAPAVAVETLKNRASVAACNDGAADRGIAPGMTVSAARSLCAGLSVMPRDPRLEQRFMRDTAACLLDYSSQVAFYGTDALVMELRGSLRLFGGLDALLERIDNRLRQSAVSYHFGVAPAARAAHWLACCRHGTVVEQTDDLKRVLRALPVAVLCDDCKQRQRLRRSGIGTLGDVMRLPRADAARRFGGAFYRPLDEALGARAEALDFFRCPPVFEAAEEFERAVDSMHRIAGAAGRLLERLERFLDRRQRAVQQFECRLYHERTAPVCLRIGTARPSARAGHLLSLLKEHLERTPLAAPVTHIVVRVSELLEPAVAGTDLFESAAAGDRDWDELMDRIVTRLGPEAVHRLTVKSDHRPEYAHHPQTVAEPGALNTAPPLRPLWLLKRCLKLGGLYWNGRPLQLCPDVERIEQGWWSGEDIRRDYRVALTAGGARLWVFQDLRSRRWYVQGLFG